jgi:D-xylose transport system substrate-binding protein
VTARTPRPSIGLAAALFALALVCAACTGSSKKAGGGTATGGGTARGSGAKIGLLLPDTTAARYETQDRPLLEAKVKSLCSACSVLSSTADQDASKQAAQAETALANGAKVLVVDPVDPQAAAAIVDDARAKHVPVISYDRLIFGAPVDYYVSFDDQKVGQLQGQALVDRLRADGKGTSTIVIINGAPTGATAAAYKHGAHTVIDPSGLTIGAEYDTPDWSPDKAQSEVQQSITRLGKGTITGVYTADDGMAGGAVAALKAAGFSPIPPVTGDGAELAAVQRILAGEQLMTVYKAVKPEAEAAAQLAVALAQGQPVPAGIVNAKTNNTAVDVPSVLLQPVPVTAANIKSTVVADGFWTAAQICTAPYKDACTKARITS